MRFTVVLDGTAEEKAAIVGAYLAANPRDTDFAGTDEEWLTEKLLREVVRTYELVEVRKRAFLGEDYYLAEVRQQAPEVTR